MGKVLALLLRRPLTGVGGKVDRDATADAGARDCAEEHDRAQKIEKPRQELGDCRRDLRHIERCPGLDGRPKGESPPPATTKRCTSVWQKTLTGEFGTDAWGSTHQDNTGTKR